MRELEYERLLIEGNDDEVALLSIDDNNTDRTFSYNGEIYFTGANWSGWPADYPPTASNAEITMVADTPVDVDWQGGGGYRIGSGTHRSNVAYYQLYVSTGTYVDYVAPSVYAYQDGGKLTFSGTVQMRLAETWYNSTAFISNDVVSDYGGVYAYPDRLALMVNGNIVTSVTASDDMGTFQLNYDYEMSGPVYSLGYRFYYDAGVLAKSASNVSNIKSLGLYLWLDDNALVTEFVPEQYVPLFKEVITEVKALPSTIYNFFFGDDGGDAASGFKSDVDSAVSSVDQVQQEIVEGLDKPEPDTIVPDLEEVVPQEDYAVYTDIFAPVMQSSLFTSMMLVVVSMAFVSYVLFGKKG